MKNISKEQIKETFYKLVDYVRKTTKRQRIVFCVLILIISVAYLYGKELWNKHTISNQAQEIIHEIVKSEKSYFENNGKYTKDIFLDTGLKKVLHVNLNSGRNRNNSKDAARRNRHNNSSKEPKSYDSGYSGDFYIEVDGDNACLVLKYKRDTSDKTIFYASFEDETIFCQGKKCFKESTGHDEKLCYVDGVCFPYKQSQTTEQQCGDGKGTQTRECVPTCEGGTCKPWSECVCQKGFGWDGNTCKQLQTEKDCTDQQCFNGVYCEDLEPTTKNIDNGSCTRLASCQKNKGWNYMTWKCSCDNKNFCPTEGSCVPAPENKEQIVLPDEEGSCSGIHYVCNNKTGWIELANNCVCNKVGTFWDRKKGEAKCSECTNKPAGAVYTSSGKNGNDCSWECEDGYQKNKDKCVKPTGQYLCVYTDLQICTDDFSKKRKIQKDAKKTNEGQPCFVEDKDNILFYNQKNRTCQICQCVDFEDEKVSN